MQDRLGFAKTRIKYDRYGLPVPKKGCAADRLMLGYVPGVVYRNYWGHMIECKGYTTDGSVVLHNISTDQTDVRNIGRADRCTVPQYVSALGIALDRKPNGKKG